MITKKFKVIFDLSNELQTMTYKKIYVGLSQNEKKSFGTFEEFLKHEKNNLQKKLSFDNQKIIDNLYIYKDTIEKENIKFDLYLFQYKHTNTIELDEDYKPLPLNEDDIYEYGAIVSLEDNNEYYNISGVFGGTDIDEHFARDKYNALKLKIKKTSEDELLDEIKNDILDQIKEYK